MADVPKDPRQLARDILSGKISIEDLARAQARARGGRVGPAAAPPLQQRPPMQQQPRPPMQASPMPLAQAMPPQQRPVQQIQRIAAPMQRGPAPLPQRRPLPAPRPQPPRPAQQQRRASTPLQVTVQPPAPTARSGGALAPTRAQVAVQDAAAAKVRTDIHKATPQARVRVMLKHRSTVREGILLAEILGPPASMRDTW